MPIFHFLVAQKNGTFTQAIYNVVILFICFLGTNQIIHDN